MPHRTFCPVLIFSHDFDAQSHDFPKISLALRLADSFFGGGMWSPFMASGIDSSNITVTQHEEAGRKLDNGNAADKIKLLEMHVSVFNDEQPTPLISPKDLAKALKFQNHNKKRREKGGEFWSTRDVTR
jgi:hypothetical protein